MSDKPSTLQQRLDEDQPPASPEALDQVILDYARAKACQPAQRRPGWWINWAPLLATASVACVAVWLVLPQPAPHFADQLPAADRALSEQQERLAAAPSPLAETRSLSVAPLSAPRPEALLPPAPERMAKRMLPASKVTESSAGLPDGSLNDGVNKKQPVSTQADLAESAVSVWQQARAAGAVFRAVGNEPGWVLTVAEQTRLVTDYGQTSYLFDSPQLAAAATGQSRRYQLVSQQHSLVLTLRELPCRDTMSDERFAVQVTVQLDDQTLSGCGRHLP